MLSATVPTFFGEMEFKLSVSIRLNGIDAASFQSGESPVNNEVQVLIDSTSFSIQKVLRDKNYPARFDSVAVSRVSDDGAYSNRFTSPLIQPDTTNLHCYMFFLSLFVYNSTSHIPNCEVFVSENDINPI